MDSFSLWEIFKYIVNKIKLHDLSVPNIEQPNTLLNIY